MSLHGLTLPAAGERIRLEKGEDAIAIVRSRDGAAVGRLELESKDRSLFVRALCIESEYRSYGAGSEAALLFNRLCDLAKVPLVRAWAPPHLGLAVYFWIRMGFRPMHGEGPEGGIWFERRRR